jgi:hypothetical protein
MHPRAGALMVVAISLLSYLPLRAQTQDPESSLFSAEGVVSDLSRDSSFAVAMHRGLHRDGVLLWPGAPLLTGRSDVDRWLASLPADSIRLTWKPLGVQVASDSSFGITWGITVSLPPGSSTAPQVGSYIAAWRRDAGIWSVAGIVFSGTRLPQAPVPSGIALSHRPMPGTGPGADFIKADSAFATLAADSGAAVAFERWASPAAVVFGYGGLLVHGPQAIGRGVAGKEIWRWYPVAAGTAGTRDLGWTAGEATISPLSGAPVYSKYLTVWTRLPDGTVRFLTDGGNARPKPATTP